MKKNQSQSYSGLYIRTSLIDDGTTPRTGDVSDSPDLIPFGTIPAVKPDVFFVDNFDENVGVPLMALQLNYIYVRTQNLDTSIQQGDIYLYYAKTNDLDHPSRWKNNLLSTTGGSHFYSVTAQADMIGITTQPFTWVPPASAEGTGYSLVTVVAPSGEKPDFSGVDDFESFVDNNGNVGWNKIDVKTPPPPVVPTLRWQTTIPYSQGDTARTVSFSLQCAGIPVGSFISFSSSNATGPVPPVVLDKTLVNTPDFNVGIQSDVPAGYTGTITFSLYSNGDPTPGSSVLFIASYLEGSGSGPKKTIVITQATTKN